MKRFLNPFHQPAAAALMVMAAGAGLLWAGWPGGYGSLFRGQTGAAKMERQSFKGADELSWSDNSPIPDRLGPWRGKLLAADARSLEILETDDVTLMEYRLGEEPPLWFAQVAGFGNRAAFHPPELCYVGSHFNVLEREPITVWVGGSARRLMRLVVSQGQERYESWYWFTANDRMTPNYYQQQFWLLLNSIRRRPMAGTLVRISTPIEDPSRANRRLLAFVTAWDAMRKLNSPHGAS